MLRGFRRALHRLTRSTVSIALLAAVVVPAAFAPPASAAVACVASDTTGNASGTNFTVSPSHGKAFYIDSSSGQNIDAAYVGYVVSSAAAKSGLWASLDGFTGGVVSLANALDGNQPMDAMSAGASQTMYFLLKASSATSTAQKHTFKIWDRRPDLAGASALYSCDYSFIRVRETIKANPNKVNGVTVATQSGANALKVGEAVTVTVEGDTGTIGAGSTPDNSSMWLSPVVRSNWPTRAIRLESVSILVNPDRIQANDPCETAGSAKCITDQLLISNAVTLADQLKNNSKSMYYRAKYVFRVIGRSASAVRANRQWHTDEAHPDGNLHGELREHNMSPPRLERNHIHSPDRGKDSDLEHGLDDNDREFH